MKLGVFLYTQFGGNRQFSKSPILPPTHGLLLPGIEPGRWSQFTECRRRPAASSCATGLKAANRGSLREPAAPWGNGQLGHFLGYRLCRARRNFSI